MATSSIQSDEIQEDLKEICVIYTRLTSFLIELGYEVFVDRMDNMNEIECLETTMRVLEIMDEFYQEAQSSPAKSSNINKTTVIDGGLGRSGYSRRLEGQEKVVAKIDKEKLKDLIKESLESSIKEQISPIAVVRDEGMHRPPQNNKISNDRILRMAQKAEAWRQQMYRDSQKAKKWKQAEKEQMSPKIPIRSLHQYKDSLEELLAGLREVEVQKVPQDNKISNERIKNMARKAEAWRQQMYRDSEKGKKWKTAPHKQIDYFYDDAAPSTSATHNTSINVENLNLEI